MRTSTTVDGVEAPTTPGRAARPQPTAPRPATDPTLSTSGERSQAERRLLAGTPLEAQRVIPSDAPMPLDAQRVFRGWIVISILVMIVVGIVLSVALITRVSNRTVYYAPTSERVGTIASREATDFEAKTTALMLVQRMESYTPVTAKTVWANVLPFLHPSLHQKLKSDYEEIAKKAEKLWQHRCAMLLQAAIGKRTAGVITMAVFYDSAELTGQTADTRTLGKVVPKAAYIEFAMDVPSKENPLGLVITRYQTYEKKDWVARGFPDMWDQFRKPDRGAK